MPANEQTWRDIPLLHRIFAVTGLLLLFATLWVFQKDHQREWKKSQIQVVNIDTKMNQWRQQQYQTTEATALHETRANELMVAKAKEIDASQLTRFDAALEKLKELLANLKDSEPISFSLSALEAERAAQAKLAQDADGLLKQARIEEEAAKSAQADYQAFRTAAKKDSDDAVVTKKKLAEQAAAKAEAATAKAQRALVQAGQARLAFVTKISTAVDALRAREDIVLGLRKFQSAKLDAAKAAMDIAVRDNLAAEMPVKQQHIDHETAIFNELNLKFQARNVARVEMQKILGEMTEDQAVAERAYQASLADLNRLQGLFAERQQTYFVGTFPFLGKKILTLPILNAFGSPLKVENLWSEGLVQDINFKKIRRFDRCTTCHQLLQRSMPGAPTDPAYIHEKDLVAWLVPPTDMPTGVSESASVLERLEKAYGLRLAPEGLVKYEHVTVSLVLPNTAAAATQVMDESKELSAVETPNALRNYIATFSGIEKDTGRDDKILQGLAPGDVIEAVGEDINLPVERVAALLLGAVGTKQPIKLKIRRGLPHPFATHPRLDLFVSDASPHKMSTYGCTICHEGQGNATEFKWVSHTPNDGPDDPEQSKRWAQEHGWFDNHHWIYPMNPERFVESGCLKCHHDVTELEPSEKFPEPPAAKLTHGFHVIRKYGCYGCHEVNGYDGPTKRVGPDLRLEPNFFAVGLQLGHLLPQRISALEKELRAAQDAPEKAVIYKQNIENCQRALELSVLVGKRNFDNAPRQELRLLFEQDRATASPETGRAFTEELDQLAGMLKDSESPGALRKPGPSLRFAKNKLDKAFIYDWTANPQSFRPSTRMPRFFGLWNHLAADEDKGALHKAEGFEPIELHAIVSYLQTNSQKFEPLAKPADIVPVATKEDKESQVKRGKQLFETRGCLACHEHQDFQNDVTLENDTVLPAAHRFRGKNEIVQGPDLSRLAAKFDPQRNPQGRNWLYSWIKEPTRYHARTLMPNLFLEPIAQKDDKGTVTYTDPVDDIVEYLMDAKHLEQGGDWSPNTQASQPVEVEQLKSLTIEYLRESFPERKLDDYYEHGIPESMRKEIKLAERDLIVSPGSELSNDQRLLYLGRRTIAKYGCYGCHDIPGFEDAKPIGTGLADWGRKDPSKLAFEHISHYLEHGHHAAHVQADSGHADSVHPKDAHAEVSTSSSEEMPNFYGRALHHGHRSGFIYQKLREPRSYDYKKVGNKKYNDRLRMPLFPFNDAEREAVITFVLGLVAEPPGEKYLYKPDARQAAILAGKQVLETYNCGGCHILSGEKWNLSFKPDTFEAQATGQTYPFMNHQFEADKLTASAKINQRGRLSAWLYGLPASTPATGLPSVLDQEDGELEADESYITNTLKYGFDLYKPVAVSGNPYQQGPQPVKVPASAIAARYPSEGGFLTKYLLPVITQRFASLGLPGKGREAFGWLPPPLIGEGEKVQTAWLHDFLLEPYPIRPATVLRMPKFNLSSADATKLVSYFAAVDNVQYPYEFSPRRQSENLLQQQAKYGTESDRLEDAMKIVVNNNYCVKCHLVGDFAPVGSDQAKGPNLARVYQRLRPDYVRRWIAKPTAILPYTSMPENIPYDASKPNLGGIDQALFHGTSIEQLDGLVDLLMNYDEYAKRKTLIAPLVPAPPTSTTATTAPVAEESADAK